MSVAKKQDKSDVKSLLMSIESMYDTCQTVLNNYTQITLMLSITIEAQMLLMKLGVMKERWAMHLPFKEACTVDFYDWSKKMEMMSKSLVTSEEEGGQNEALSEYCPSKHFVLDLYEMLPEAERSGDGIPYYRETNIPKLIAGQEKIRKEVSKHWKSYKYRFSDLVVRQFDGRIGNILQMISERGVSIRMVCSDVLQQLSVALYQLHEMPTGVIQRDQFARLAERVINEPEYGGRKAQANARRDVNNLKNTTPEEEWEKRCEEEIRASVDVICEMKYGRKIFSYIGQNLDVKGRTAGLGKFLNSIRRDIDDSELSYLMEQVFRILYFREDIEQQAVAAVDNSSEEAEDKSSKDALTVYKRRLAVKPVRPALPDFFRVRLARNREAIEKYYDIFHQCGFYIGRTLIDKEKKRKEMNRYAKWKWKHVREAFMNLGFIDKDTPKKGLAEYFEQVFPYLDADNVNRGFNSRGTYENPMTFNKVVSEIEYEFDPVKKLIDS